MKKDLTYLLVICLTILSCRKSKDEEVRISYKDDLLKATHFIGNVHNNAVSYVLNKQSLKKSNNEKILSVTTVSPNLSIDRRDITATNVLQLTLEFLNTQLEYIQLDLTIDKDVAERLDNLFTDARPDAVRQQWIDAINEPGLRRFLLKGRRIW